nr:phospholipase D-like domain-containing protein [uncultured Roseibium sp.]
MTDDADYVNRLKAKVQQITTASGMTVEAVKKKMTSPLPEGAEPEMVGAPRATSASPETATLEAVVRWSRPVLWINNDTTDEDFTIDAMHEVDEDLLEEMRMHQSGINRIIPSVGRIELFNNMHLDWAGTGWVIDFDGASDIIVTNAHVAELFARQGPNGFIFRPGIPDFQTRQAAQIDFREEIMRTQPREFPITEVIWIAPDNRPDVAFLRVERTAGTDRVSAPIRLGSTASSNALLSVIGYPGKDDRVEYADKLSSVFGESFGIKRLALGRVTGQDSEIMTHDASTLPGSSGSVVWDSTKGVAVGLHFAGTAFTNNFAVPARVVQDLIRTRPWQGAERPSAPAPVPIPAAAPVVPTAGPSVGQDGSISFTVPLHINVQVSVGEPATSNAMSPVKPGKKLGAEAAVAGVETMARASAGAASVLEVSAEYLFHDGEITDEKGVVVAVTPDASLNPATYGLGTSYEGVPVVIEIADPQVIAEEMFGFEIETEAFRKRRANYTRDLSDPKFDLSPVTDKIKVQFSVSPEAGWPVLREFLKIDDFEHLTVGMYHVTAPHIVEALMDIAKRSRPNPRITLTLDRQRGDKPVNPDDISAGTKGDDIPERETIDALKNELGNKFLYAKASLGSRGLFATAYHIKVAVWTDRLSGNRKEDKVFWLSSGNWQSSNQQPLSIDVDAVPSLTFDDVADYNREWHAVVEHAGLAKTFREHLTQDQTDNALATATESGRRRLDDEILVPVEMLERAGRPTDFKPFPPLDLDEEMTIHPLLTPDNYPEVVLELVREARDRLWIENQSFNLWKRVEDTPAHFMALASAIREKQQNGVDVRILFRNIFGSERKTLRRLKDFGIRTDEHHIRFFPKNHTKGMVVDDHSVMLGSHNLTAGGTGPNRDASLIVRNKKANAYFAELFLHDWTQYGKHRPAPDTEGRRPVLISRDGARIEAPGGYVSMSLGEFLGEG